MSFWEPLVADVRYRLRTTRLRAPLVWYRHKGLNPRDVFLASYPRSGNTWMRFLLSEVLTQTEADFRDVGFAVADIRYYKKGSRLLGSGRIVKTHEPYRREYKKAIYFVRDPRDVAISYYEFDQCEESLDDFVQSFVDGKANAFGPWCRHVSGWLHSPLVDLGNLLVIRYEDMRVDTEETLSHALKFLGVSATEEIIRRAIANNALQRMRAKEDRARATGIGFCGEPIQSRGRRIRNGSIGEWRERLTQAQARIIEDHAGDLLTRLGYTDRKTSPLPDLNILPAERIPSADAVAEA